MSDRGDRFRRLGSGQTRDLFEHYGVAIDPRAPAMEPGPQATVAATKCRGCGWYRPLPADDACTVCGHRGTRP